MDEQALNELLECSVCLERLDHTSKVLQCQHTFCRRCLDEILSTKKELRCPECRTLVSCKVEDLPANILLIRLLDGLKNANQGLAAGCRARGAPKRQENSPSGNSSKRQSEISSQPCAKALYNYDAKEQGDLSFKKGDVIMLCKQIDQNWFHGELNSQHGFFPASYVQVITSLPSTVPQCKTLYEFDMKDENEKDCLKFQKDEVIQVIRQVDDNWLEGRKGDKIGIFPISFVELNEAAKTLLSTRCRSLSAAGGDAMSAASRRIPPSISPAALAAQIKQQQQKQQQQQASSPTTSSSSQQKRHSFTATSHTHKASTPSPSQQRRSLELSPTTSVTSSAEPFPAPLSPATGAAVSPKSSQTLQISKSQDSVELPSCSGSAVSDSTGTGESSVGKFTSPVYIALYNYKPQKDDEVELRKGDCYTVDEKCQDGWFKGQCLRTGFSGVFPGNYVQVLRTPSAFRPANPNILNIRAKGTPPTSPTMDSASSSGVSTPLVGLEPKSTGILHSTTAARQAIPAVTPRSRSSLPLPAPVASSSHQHSSVAGAEGTAKTHAGSSTVKKPGLPLQCYANLAAMQHSMSASANITPPNVVAGTPSNGSLSVHGSKDREKKEKRDKDKLPSLVKRLTMGKMKKTKSPSREGENPANTLVTDANHARSGSYPMECRVVDTVQHKKTGSLDSSALSSGSKPGRPKPLAREKYRCIVPYPPQSEAELELKVGDVVVVYKKRDDGWFKGASQQTGKTGLFPGSFVTRFD